jgi:KDO2-lipid IV(A) lauroyltransferase
VMGRRRTPCVKQMIWRLEALAFDTFTLVARALPMDGVSWALGRIAVAVGPLTRAHRTALLGLKIAFPDKTAAERERLARAQWENFGRYIGEFPLVDRITPERGRVEIDGFDRLRAIALSGRPAILISGHFSNIEVMAAAILSAGIVCDVTYRAANNPLVDARIIAGRARYGVRLFAPKGADGARSLLTSLAAGRSIAILNDQKYDAGTEGVFFGKPVRTNTARSSSRCRCDERGARGSGSSSTSRSSSRAPRTASPTSIAASTPSTPSSRRGCGNVPKNGGGCTGAGRPRSTEKPRNPES